MTQLTPQQLVGLKRVSDAVPSPCGTWLATAVGRLNADGTLYIHDIWKVPLHVSLSDGGPPTQLTFGDTNDTSPCFRQDGSLGFLSNRSSETTDLSLGKPPTTQVWLLSFYEEKQPEVMTDELSGVDQFTFAASGNLLAVITGICNKDLTGDSQEESDSCDPSIRHYTTLPIRRYNQWVSSISPHLVVFDAEGNDRRDLTLKADVEHQDTGFDVSYDGRKIAIIVTNDAEDGSYDSALLVIDVLSEKSTVVGKQPLTNLKNPRFNASANAIACEHHIRSKTHLGKSDIWVVDLETEDIKTLAKNWDRMPLLAQWLGNEPSLIVTANDEGQIPIFCIDIETDTVKQITSRHAGGSYGKIHVIDNIGLVGIWSSFIHPPEPFLIEVWPDSRPTILSCLSGINKDEINTDILVENIYTEASDGTPVHSFLIKPEGANASLPTVFWIHGGPIYSWSDEWHWKLNPLIMATQGYASVLVHPRGSTGFGQVFVEDIRGNVWGEKCYTDIMAVVDKVSALECVDEGKMAVFGCSFGGYMTNWIGVNHTRFKCLVTQAGIFSLSSFCSATDFPEYWHRLLNMAEHPFNNLSDSDKYSPHRKIANWTSPTLIVHGEKDFRVPIDQSLALFESLLYHGNEAELIVFSNEGHGIRKPKNAEAWYGSIIKFLNKYMV